MSRLSAGLKRIWCGITHAGNPSNFDMIDHTLVRCKVCKSEHIIVERDYEL